MKPKDLRIGMRVRVKLEDGMNEASYKDVDGKIVTITKLFNKGAFINDDEEVFLYAEELSRVADSEMQKLKEKMLS